MKTRILAVAGLAAFAAACSDSISPGSDRTVSLSFSTRPETGALLNQSGMLDDTITSGSDVLIITSAQVVLREIELKRQNDDLCEQGAGDDFIASRYGKSAGIGGLVTMISVVGIMPYIALQLKAISTSFNTLFHNQVQLASQIQISLGQNTALYVALNLAMFSILFGTRHIDVTERHEGMVAAIAFESIVKLVAFTAVGLFVTFVLFDGPVDILQRAGRLPEVARLMSLNWEPGQYASWGTLTLISMSAILFLPRQFQVLVVENVNEDHVRTASWLFPLYLLAINLFVLPVAFAGLIVFEGVEVDADMFVLTLPLLGEEGLLAITIEK